MSHFRLFFKKFPVAKTLHFTQKGVPVVSNFCRRSMILQNCVKNIAQTMFRRCRLQTAKRFCRFAGFCGTVCKTMSFSLTASEFVCSTLPLLFEFCIAQFFLYRMRYFFTLTVILSCNFCIGKYGFGNLTVDFHCQKPSLMQTRRCVHKICVKEYTPLHALLCFVFIYRTFALHNFFVPYALYFTLTAILFCIFTLLNTVAVVLPLIFSTVKYLF